MPGRRDDQQQQNKYNDQTKQSTLTTDIVEECPAVGSNKIDEKAII